MSADNRSFSGPWDRLPADARAHINPLLRPAYEAVVARRNLVEDPARSYLPKPLVSVRFDVRRLYYADESVDASKLVRVAELEFREPFDPLLEDVVTGWANPMRGMTGDRRVVYLAFTPTGGLYLRTLGLHSHGQLVTVVTPPVMDRDVVRNAQYGEGSRLFFPDTSEIPVEARVGRFFHALTKREGAVTRHLDRAVAQQQELLRL